MIPVQIKRLHPSAILPIYETAHSTCADIHALCESPGGDAAGCKNVIRAGEMRLIRTGLSVRPAPGYATKLHPRSGLALKHGITLKNCTGIIDHDYPVELCVLLWNTSADDFVVGTGMRIAQLEVHPLVQAEFIEVDELSDVPEVSGMAERTGGFGSTGVGAEEPAAQLPVAVDSEATAKAFSDRSKNLGHVLSMFGELMLECSIESATGVTHFAAEEVGAALRMVGQNISAGHAVCITHDQEMTLHTAAQLIEALQKV